MMDEQTFEISIPSDEDGYILLQCEHCGEYFKITAEDCNSDGILRLVCPACGLESENYFTQDVVDLALTITKNYAMDEIFNVFKDLEKSASNGLVKFEAGKKPKHEPENYIHSGIEALEVVSFPCCHHTAKIKPLLKFTGCYCPCCGVKNYEFE